MPKFGETVLYIEGLKSYNALVIAERDLEHHSGEDGQPMLSLVIVKPDANGANLAGTIRESEYVKFVHDVPHSSHAFDAEQMAAMERSGVTTSQAYPGGRVPGGRWMTLTESIPASTESLEKQAPQPEDTPKTETVQ